MREIGGYLDFELKFNGNAYHNEAIGLNLARNAILYIVQAKKYQRIYLPRLIGDSIPAVLRRNSIEQVYYPVDERCRPLFHHKLGEKEAVLIINYYGQLPDKEIISYKKMWDRVILDNTQDFFAKPIAGIDTVYNARKYFGIPDGAYLYTDQTPNDRLEKNYSYNKLEYLVGRFEKDADSFYQNFLQSEESLYLEEPKSISAFSENILRGISYEKVYKTRLNNFCCLHARLASFNRWSLSKGGGTYMYPFWSTKGGEVRRRLIAEKIYIPVLWPNVLEEMTEDTPEYQMAENILPLPVDQRYTEADMKYLADKLLNILKEI